MHRTLRSHAPFKLTPPDSYYRRFGKRGLDIVFSLLGLCLLSPVLLLITILLIIFQGGSPFFRQIRIGRHCRPFFILKFRTMNDKRDAHGQLLGDQERTTWIGHILRASSLDEFPELVNVLKGDMSLIGPRPWIREQMSTFDPNTRALRMAVRPGVSGLAQVLGRNYITFRQRVCLDLLYQRHLSIATDCSILLFTFYKVLRREGIDQIHGSHYQKRLLPRDPETRGLKGNLPRHDHSSF